MKPTFDSYDILIVGAGPAGIFTAYEAKQYQPDARILIIEKGNSIEKRKCPKRKTGVCAKCDPCAITTGFSGSGSFSDGKLSISYDGEVGGDLIRYIGAEPFRKLLEYTDNLYLKFGADPEVHGIDINGRVEIIRRRAAQAHLKLIESGVRHMGTEKAYDIYARIQKALEALQIEMCFCTQVTDFLIESEADGQKKIAGVITEDGQRVYGDKVVVAIGRDGSQWLNSMCKK